MFRRPDEAVGGKVLMDLKEAWPSFHPDRIKKIKDHRGGKTTHQKREEYPAMSPLEKRRWGRNCQRDRVDPYSNAAIMGLQTETREGIGERYVWESGHKQEK